MGSAFFALVPLVLLQAQPMVVLEPDVAQYRAAADAAEKLLPGAVELDPGDPSLAARLRDASVVLAVGRKALKAAREHVAGKPVIFCMVLGVSRTDLSGAVTGVPLEADPAVAVERIHAALPSATRIGAIFDPHDSGLFMEHARQAAGELGLKLYVAPVSDSIDVRGVVEAMVGKVDALWLPPNPRLFGKEVSSFVLGEAAENKLPLFGFLESYTNEGALASMSSNFMDEGARAGKLAADIASKPESQRLPVPPPQYAPGDFSLNLKTARALGVDVPNSAIASAGPHVVR